MPDRRPRVKFAVRYPAGSGRWWYRPVVVPDASGGAFMPMAYPPAVGDLIMLHDRYGPPLDGGPVFRVLARQWAHAGYGSATYPYGDAEPREGPLLDVICEPAGKGVYADETDICADPSCQAVIKDGEWWFPPGSDAPDPHEHVPWKPPRPE